MSEIPIKSGIYLLRNRINNKIYIGKSINLRCRINQHKNSVTRKSAKSPIGSAIRKYGWENFDIEILEIFENIDNEMLLRKESDFIKTFEIQRVNSYGLFLLIPDS